MSGPIPTEALQAAVPIIEQLQALGAIRCDEAQGFYLNQPMDAQAIRALLDAQDPAAGTTPN